MAQLENISVNVEKLVVHDLLRDFAERLYADHGIQLIKARFDWRDVSTDSKKNEHLMDIRIESQTKWHATKV